MYPTNEHPYICIFEHPMNQHPFLDILLADPYHIFREGIRQYLAEWYPQATFRNASTAAEVIAQLKEQQPDLLLTALELPPGDAFEIFKAFPHPAGRGVLIISHFKEPRLVREICKLGALGYIHKSCLPDELQRAVKTVLRREVYLGKGIALTEQAPPMKDEENKQFRDYFHLRYELTPRELEVLAQIKQGLNNREIAEVLFISEQTVSVHRKNILRKVGVNNTQKLLKITYEHHLT